MFPTTINQHLLDLEYAVRGPLASRAAELSNQGRNIIHCNIGNPQALGQKPITFYRQVLSLLEYPDAITYARNHDDFFHDDVLDYAEEFLEHQRVGMGAYTESKGPRFIRESITDFINKRDHLAHSGGIPSNPDYIFLTDGASAGARNIIEILIAKPNDGIMIPIPQYPLYSATVRRCGGVQVNYYPDEDSDWALSRDILIDSLSKAQKQGVHVKAIVVINPGNPTGAVLDEKSIRDVIRFAGENDLAIIADEVYQENLYGTSFISFAKAIGNEEIPLFSLHSISKGYFGECGHRGGYLEVRNPPIIDGSELNFIEVLVKQASVSLCSNTVGQALVYMMVNPPKEGSKALAELEQEKESILNDQLQKATMIKSAFLEMDSMECFGRIGALYLFPRMNKLPKGKSDFDYCWALLEETGLSTVNGSGFGQKEGTQHLRIAFIPPMEMLQDVLPKWIEFHNKYVNSI
ncbi:MAG: aminotransferase class I/II-fold pyridoxal phosphate-dependent enzyme [Fidelibacterota bacterium]